MARAFVVVGEAAPVMTDLDRGFLEVDKVVGTDRRAVRCARRALRSKAKNRIEWILREDVFDVGDQQFLVLLLVMHSQNQDRLDFFEESFVSGGKKIVDVCADRGSIALCFPDGRTRD